METNNFLFPSYKKHQNFGIITTRQEPYEKGNFGKKVVFELTKQGHFLNNIHLVVNIDALSTASGSTFTTWANGFMFALVEKVELDIGGMVVDTRYGIQMDIANELTMPYGHKDGINIMTGKKDIISNITDTENKQFILPLDFWFNKSPSQALPISLLRNQTVKLTFYFREFADLVCYDGVTVPTKVNMSGCYLQNEYFYVERDYLQKFSDKSLEDGGLNYLIESVAFNEKEYIDSTAQNYISKLNFSHPLKELQWVMVETDSIDNNDYFNYSRRSDNKNMYVSAKIIFDGISQTVDYLPENYFRLLNPQKFHSRIPMKYISTYSFSYDPENINPTGLINISKINNKNIHINMNTGNQPCSLYVFGIFYNIFSIKDGFGQIKYLY
jgi:hypothetical protein